MKRFLLAAALALTLHGLLLVFGRDLVRERSPAPPRHLTVTFSVREAPEHGPGPQIEHLAPPPGEPVMVREPAREPPVVKKPPPREDPPKAHKAVPQRKTPAQPRVKVRPEGMPPQRDTTSPPKKRIPAKKERVRPSLPVETQPQPEDASGPEASSVPVVDASQGTMAAPVEQTTGGPVETLPDIPGETVNTGPAAGEERASLSTAEKIIRATPDYRENPRPEYPRLARRKGHEGTVVLEVLVNRAGKVEDLRLLTSSGYAALDRSAMKSVRDWLFEPGRIGDRTVDMWVRVPVRFELKPR